MKNGINEMNWIEIIEIRLSRGQREKKIQIMKNLIDEFKVEIGKESITIYNHISLDTDFIIQIKNNTNKATQNGSKLGIQLVSALREIGLVNHNVWIEKKMERK